MTLTEPTGGTVITLADRLKAHREELGISQSQAARELDVARTAYRLWELEAAAVAGSVAAPLRGGSASPWPRCCSGGGPDLGEGGPAPPRTRPSATRRATGETTDALAAEREEGDFFRQAQTMLDRSSSRGS